MNQTFIRFARLTAVAVAALLASLAAAAAVTPNPYGRISESNVFRLQPPPSQTTPKPEPPPRRLLPKIFITGLIEVHGVPRALVEITEPGQPIKRPILAAGGTCDLLEVLHIDVVGERVRVRLDGEEEILSIEKPKPSTAVPPPAPVPVPFRTPMAVRG